MLVGSGADDIVKGMIEESGVGNLVQKAGPVV